MPGPYTASTYPTAQDTFPATSTPERLAAHESAIINLEAQLGYGAGANSALAASGVQGGLTLANTPASFYGYNFWSMPPQDAGVALSATAVTSANGLYTLVPITKAVTLSSVAVNISVAGGTLTAGSNFLQVFTLAGVSLGYTGTQVTNWGTAGLYNVALTASAAGLAVTPSANPFVVVVMQVKGTTLPRPLGFSSAVGTSAWPVPSSISGTGVTIPSYSGYYSTFTAGGTNATIADYTAIDGCGFWVALT